MESDDELSPCVHHVQLLLSSFNANVLAIDLHNRTALIHSCLGPQDNGVIPTLLLTRSPHLITMRDDTGRSALHWACIKGHVDIVKVLLHYKADTLLEDQKGKLPMDLICIEASSGDKASRIRRMIEVLYTVQTQSFSNP